MSELSPELVELLKLSPPSAEPQHIGFLEICGKGHSENVNSNVYAYFLDPKNETGCEALFYEALMKTIDDAKGIQEAPDGKFLESYTVAREYSSEGSKRIDILLNDKSNKRAIILENKIYHIPNNPFKEYWHALDYEAENKMGILLSLKAEKATGPCSEHFLNILHIDWIRNIKNAGLPSGLDPRHYTYLNDFFHTIERLTMSTNLSPQAEFFFDHVKQIEKAIACRNSANDYLSGQLIIATQALNSKTEHDILKSAELQGSNERYRYIVFKELKYNQEIYLVVMLENFLKGKMELQILIETHKGANQFWKDLKKASNKSASANDLHGTDTSKSSYTHVWSKLYEIEIDKLAEAIATAVQNDFIHVITEMHNAYSVILNGKENLEKSSNSGLNAD